MPLLRLVLYLVSCIRAAHVERTNLQSRHDCDSDDTYSVLQVHQQIVRGVAQKQIQQRHKIFGVLDDHNREDLVEKMIGFYLGVDDEYALMSCGYDGIDLNMSTMVNKNVWPGCGVPVGEGLGRVGALADFDSCNETCLRRQVMEEMGDFSAMHGGERVSYMTRAGKDRARKEIEVVELTGWWLPAPQLASTTPRILVVHGLHENSNSAIEQFAAFLLRKLGYSVLVHSYRDTCYSATSKAHINEWGHAHPFDILGAWDFLQKDPDGVLGGPMPSSKVGIMGFSEGAFLTGASFGMEAAVPAVWLDAPPFNLFGALRAFALNLVELRLQGEADKVESILPYVYEQGAEYASHKGVHITDFTPENTLPNGPDNKRPIMVSGNSLDDVVIYDENHAKLISFLKQYPEKYLVSTLLFTHACNGKYHCIDHYASSGRYAAELCIFWSRVFNASQNCSVTSQWF
mmetsp:Transcript_61985/g.98232  ORF Transcript_61985/g.98232 Transcript_61985/m.98232 type:complete len:459 (-) Transcript_61985:164-1540(-)